ncbi:hypothetical protein RHSIM_Rhsim05G0075400 [Rhododendron simsii]|uniref:RRM domain-containing protein n=1 Tax=Rhododendron simsii TaxID=118357 RepID=A0A834LNC7_RHOSS|nr:hypothetical protein RHSIM_Rhsim05G0075400 [Rhododendron simsii]
MRRANQREKGDANRGHATLFVDNLPDQMRKAWVYNLFCKYGKIREIFIPNKKSKITGRCFGFIRCEQGEKASQAAEEVNGKWIWDHQLMVKRARFLINRDYDQGATQNSFDLGQRRQFQPDPRRQKNQTQKKPLWNLDNIRRNEEIKGKKVNLEGIWRRKENPNAVTQKEDRRGKQIWKRKEKPESSKQGEGRNKDPQQNTINIQLQPVGNGWLYRSAVGKLRRLCSVVEMEKIFKKEKISDVQIKAMGGRFLVLTFPSKEIRDEIIQQQWLLGWFDEVKPWDGEQAKRERFAWIACYGMPLNVWNVPSFRAIGSKWGHFIEVDENALREKSYEKGRLLIATDNFRKIEGIMQITVERKVYEIIVEEEETFRIISSSKDFSNSGSEADGDGDDMAEADKDAKKNADWVEEDEDANTPPKIQSEKDETNRGDKVNDVEVTDTCNGGLKNIDQEIARNKEKEVRQSMADKTTNALGVGNHQSWEPRSANSTSPLTTDEGINEVNSNSTHGLDSLVPDSQTPSKGESERAEVSKNQVQSVGAQEAGEAEMEDHQEGLDRNRTNINSPIVIDSNCSIRPSQLKGINLEVELNPSTIRKTIRSQQYAECTSKEDSMHEYSSDDISDQDHNSEWEEDNFEDTIAAGEILGIDFEESDVRSMKKTFEAEGKETKALNNNRFALLLRSSTNITQQ